MNESHFSLLKTLCAGGGATVHDDFSNVTLDTIKPGEPFQMDENAEAGIALAELLHIINKRCGSDIRMPEDNDDYDWSLISLLARGIKHGRAENPSEKGVIGLPCNAKTKDDVLHLVNNLPEDLGLIGDPEETIGEHTIKPGKRKLTFNVTAVKDTAKDVELLVQQIVESEEKKIHLKYEGMSLEFLDDDEAGSEQDSPDL